MQIGETLALRNYQRVGGRSYVDWGKWFYVAFCAYPFFHNVWGLIWKGVLFHMVTIKGKSYNIVVRCLGVSFEPLSRKESGRERQEWGMEERNCWQRKDNRLGFPRRMEWWLSRMSGCQSGIRASSICSLLCFCSLSILPPLFPICLSSIVSLRGIRIFQINRS